MWINCKNDVVAITWPQSRRHPQIPRRTKIDDKKLIILPGRKVKPPPLIWDIEPRQIEYNQAGPVQHKLDTSDVWYIDSGNIRAVKVIIEI